MRNDLPKFSNFIYNMDPIQWYKFPYIATVAESTLHAYFATENPLYFFITKI